ncbi:MAG: WG repeat-containing protein [Pseudomonadota bacterium]
MSRLMEVNREWDAAAFPLPGTEFRRLLRQNFGPVSNLMADPVMRLRSKSWRITAMAALLTLLSAPAFSQPESSAPSAESRNGASGENPPPLPPGIRKELEFALAQEEKAKKIGVSTFRSFPKPVCVAGKCGAINRDGTYAVVPAYNRVDPFIEGVAVVQVRHRYGYLYGYVDETGRMIWKPQFAVAGPFSRGFAQVDFEGKSGLIDRDGKVALWPQFGYVMPFTHDRFWVTEERNVSPGNTGQEKFYDDLGAAVLVVDGVSIRNTVVAPKGKWGLVDRAGTWIRRPEFLDVRVFDKNDAGLMWAKTDAGWGLILSDLSWQVEPKFEEVGPVYDGVAPFMLDRRWGLVDTKGRIVIEPRFESMPFFTGPHAPARVNKLFGLIDRTGAWLVEPKYDGIYWSGLLPKSWWTTRTGKDYGLLDDTLRELIAPQLDQAPAMCVDGRIVGSIEKKRRFFSRSGSPLEDDEAGCDSMITSRKQGP